LSTSGRSLGEGRVALAGFTEGDLLEELLERRWPPKGKPVRPHHHAPMQIISKAFCSAFLGVIFLSVGCAELGTGPDNISGYRDPMGASDGRVRVGPRSRVHTGVDLRDTMGAPVLAAADGEVSRALDQSSGACGKQVMLRHTFKREIQFGHMAVPDEAVRFTRYCHLGAVSVKPGDRVQRGEVIGAVGMTGEAAFVPHIHWELCIYRSCGEKGTQDPLEYTVGCFDPELSYPQDRLVLTYPVRCRNAPGHDPRKTPIKVWPEPTP
jgi:hypothetical protein